jgi:hypothetical protein
MISIDIERIEAINSLRPGAIWTETNGKLEWNDDVQTQPTEDEIAEQIVKRNYVKNRIVAYPSIEDQLDMIFHDGIEVWRDKIQSVKNKYPKL